MIKVKMINSIFLALYISFFLSSLKLVLSVSISDLESSIKALIPNNRKNSTSLRNKLISNQNEIEKLNQKTLKSNNKNNKHTDENDSDLISSFSLYPKKFETSQCDLITDGPICLSKGDRVFLPDAKPNNLIAHWSFDDINPIDNSGNGNHAINTVEAGPALGGVGNSAFFSDGNFLEVPHNKQFEIAYDFSVTFWFYLIKPKKGENNNDNNLCPLIQKGSDNLADKSYNRFPAIFFDIKNKNFKIYTKTNYEESNEGEAFISNARATNEKWLHIALIKKNTKILFYVNGILDSQMELKGSPILNVNSLFIGNTPTLNKKCKFPFLMDELRFYNYSIDEDYVQAEASPAIGGIEPSFLQLGCFDCELKEAVNSCNEGYKICSSIEMHTAGYQISRAMGWLRFDTHVWTSAALQHEKEFEGKKGLGLCCVEIK